MVCLLANTRPFLFFLFFSPLAFPLPKLLILARPISDVLGEG